MSSRSEVEGIATELRQKSVSTSPVHLNSIASRMGVSAISYSEIPEEGRLIRDAVGRVFIELRSDRPTHRRRFTLAHELVHLHLDHGKHRSAVIHSRVSAQRHVEEERLCDSVAAALLIPAEVVEDLTSELPIALEGLKRLASGQGCSLSAAAARITEVTGVKLLVAKLNFGGDRNVPTIEWASRRPKGMRGSIRCVTYRRARGGGYDCIRLEFGQVQFDAKCELDSNGAETIALFSMMKRVRTRVGAS